MYIASYLFYTFRETIEHEKALKGVLYYRCHSILPTLQFECQNKSDFYQRL